jgi:hypothetical protein
MYPKDKFVYKYLAGPVQTEEELNGGFMEGNCRFALQLYFYRIHSRFFERDEIYLPGGYKALGKFVFKETDIDINQLKAGDVIYAQNLRNKQNQKVDKSPERYKDKDEWLYYLHSLIYLGKLYGDSDTNYVWHATHIAGGPVVWDWSKFIHYYKPISAKRVI